jgi:hypothetical protein
MIEKRDGKWVVLSMSGQVLGTHDTEEEAKAQLALIEARVKATVVRQRRA